MRKFKLVGHRITPFGEIWEYAFDDEITEISAKDLKLTPTKEKNNEKK